MRQELIRGNLEARARIITEIRAFFTDCGYLEVDTPIRTPAQAPEAHIDPVSSEGWYLQSSPELCMKRLLSAGFERIFQIARCFRRGERGDRHLPELTLLEWYRKGGSYLDLMEETEALVRRIAAPEKRLTYRGEEIDLSGPWERFTVEDAFERHASVSMEQALSADTFDEVMGLEIEPSLGRGTPTFIYDYPASKGALARLKPTNPAVAERFELYICGLELCNAFTELTDPVEQRARFTEEIACRAALGKPPCPMPEKFLEDLSTMPDAAGIALGVDRLVMLFTDAPTIDDVTAFTPEEL